MSNILITGASGFIGSNLARKLSKSGHKISLFINKKSNLWRIQDIISNFDTHFVNISDADEIKQKIRQIKPDLVYHFATYGVYPSQKNLSMMIKTNIIGSINLMQVLNEYNDIERFVNIGSSFEYGSKSKPIKETDMVEPNTAYGVTKVAQSHFAQYFAFHDELPAVTLRIFNAYGMYEEPGRLITDIMLSSINKSTLNVSTFEAKRDFIHMDDIIDAVIKASKMSEIGEIFNIGGGRLYSVKEVIDLTNKITNVDLKISLDKKKQREFDKKGGKVVANIQKAKKILNWEPKLSLENGLSITYDWYRKNIHLYKKTK